MNFDRRIKKLRTSFKQNEAFLVSDYVNIHYLTGFTTLSPEERESWLLVTPQNIHIFTSSLYSEEIEAYCKDTSLIPYILSRERRLIPTIQEITKNEHIISILFEADDLLFSEYELLKKFKIPLSPTHQVIAQIRAIKDTEEVANIAKACELTTECLLYIQKEMKIGAQEKEIAFKLEHWTRLKGYAPAFTPIVGIDANGSKPHHQNAMTKIKKDSIILIDYGIAYEGYISDISRVFFMKEAPQEATNIYRSLLAIQEDTIEKIGSSNVYKEIEEFCRGKLDAASLPQYQHTTGHGVGLEIHEFPKVSLMSEEKIETNQVVTIEPGVYLQGKFGMRIEDTVQIGPGKQPIVLTKFPKFSF